MTKIRTKAPQTSPATPSVPAKTALPRSRSFTAEAETTPSETATEGRSHFFSPPDPPNLQKQSNSPTGYSLNRVSILDYTPAPLQMKRLVTSPGTESEEESNILEVGENETREPAPPATPPPEDNQPNSTLQRQAKGDGSFVANSDIADTTYVTLRDRIIQRKGRGFPLPDSARNFMESRFENDFSQVRLHTDSEAVQLSHNLKAKAFTHENDIYFNAGQYNPNSTGGKQLLAHELTHTIQQTGAKVQRKALRDRTSKVNRIQRKSPPKIQRSSDEENVSINLKPISSPLTELSTLSLQPQLIVGAPGDKSEQEADRIASQVMSMSSPAHSEPIQRANKRRPAIPYNLLHAEDEDKDEQNVNISLQPEGNGSFQASSDIEHRLNSKKGGGSSLPKTTQNFMESRFQNDFGKVRVHTGSEAVQMNTDLQAKAFTHGQDIYFNSGQYNPDSTSGKKLLAHELTHTIQQTGPKVKTKSALHRPVKINKIQRSSAVIQRDKKADLENDKKIAEEKIAAEMAAKKQEGGDFSAAERAKSATQHQAEKTQQLANAENEEAARQRGATLEQESEQVTETQQTEAESTATESENIITTEKQKDIAEAKKAEQVADAEAAEPVTAETTEAEAEPEASGEQPASDEGLLEATGTTEGLEGEGQAEAAPEMTEQSAPQSPDDDPAFQAAVQQSQEVAAEQSTHKPAQDKAKEAQEAAVDSNQQMREAQASQTQEASQKEVKPFNREAFVSALLAVLEQNKPQSQQDVEQGKGASGATAGIKQQIENSKANSGGELEQSATRPPAPELEQPKISIPTPDAIAEAGTPPPPDGIDAAATVPKSQSEADVEQPLAETRQALDVLIPDKIQTKLTVGAPGDKYEQEADRMAEAVMRMSETETVASETEEAPQRMPEDSNSQTVLSAQVSSVDDTIARTPQSLIQRQDAPADTPGFTAETPTQDAEVILDKNRVELFQSEAGIDVTGAVDEAQTNTEVTAQQFREQEQGVQTETLDVQAGAILKTQDEMFATRSQEFVNVGNTQALTQQKDEGERAKITQDIQAIYNETQTNVNGILNNMDAQVNAEFEATNRRARAAFEARQRQLFEAWKQKYYYQDNPLWLPHVRVETGWAYVRVHFSLRRAFNSPLWAINKIFTGLPDEVNQIYAQAREAFIAEQRAGVYRIADIVEAGLTNAQNAVKEGRDRISTYVDSLPDNLKAIGAEAEANVQAQFDSLESNINDRQNQLVDDLTAKYEASLKDIDDRIQSLKDQNKSLISKAISALADLAKWVLRKVLSVVEPVISKIPGIGSQVGSFLDAFIDDPVGIMGTLFGGLGKGFENFGKNIAANLQTALFDWLLGIDMPIKFPDKFDLQGILDIILQVLGLTKDYVLDMASGLMPDWVGEILAEILEGGPAALNEYLESSSEEMPPLAVKFFEAIAKFPTEGVMALWDFMKTGLSSLKDLFMSEVMFQVVIPQIVIAGIQWILSLTNPVSGILKIAKAVVDLLLFLITNMDMIREVIEAIGGAIKAVISKSISQVASAVEFALVKIIPLVLGLFASILGLGGIPRKIQTVIGTLKSPVDDVLGGVFNSIGSVLMVLDPTALLLGAGALGSGYLEGREGKKGKKGKSRKSNKTQKPKTGRQKTKAEKKQERKEKRQAKKVLKKVKSNLKKKIKKDPEVSDVKRVLPGVEEQYDLQSLRVTQSQKTEESSRYVIVGTASSSSSSKKKKVQRKAVPGSHHQTEVTPDIERSLDQQQGRGESLSRSVREPMETAFGVNFAPVRIHQNPESDRLSRSLDAKAFTTGTDIFFRQDSYKPQSSGGQKLLAHELTHVVQQSGEQPNIHRFFDTNTYRREAIPSIQTRQSQIPTIQLAPDKTKNTPNDTDLDREQEVKVRSNIKNQTLTMNVTVRDKEDDEDRDWDFLRPPEEVMEDESESSEAIANLQLSPTLISNVVKAIQAIVNNNPDKMAVSRQLEDVRVQFDLDVVKLVQAATVGDSFAYIVNIQGEGKFIEAQKMQGFLKRLARNTGTTPETRMRSTSIAPEPNANLSNPIPSPEPVTPSTPTTPETQTPTNVPPTPTVPEPPQRDRSNAEVEPPQRDRANADVQAPPQLDVATKVRPISSTSVDVVVRADPESQT